MPAIDTHELGYQPRDWSEDELSGTTAGEDILVGVGSSFRRARKHIDLSTFPPPALSSGSSASTRSTAYSSNGSALAHEYSHSHVQVASQESPISPVESPIGLAVSDDVEPSSSYRAPIDQTSRWSQSYSQSLRSRSSLVRNNSISGREPLNTPPAAPAMAPNLRTTPSYDLSWQPVDERDEVDLTSEDEDTDLDMDDDDDDDPDREEERTAAIVIAEEGRGLIVRGDGVATVKLRVDPGTTHLLVGSSSTPNAIPTFLNQTLPGISSSLLALDISCNFLGALPLALEACVSLEELNISSNPIRAIPIFVASLTNLRVLIADSTGINTLPPQLSALEHLHSLSIRRNKMYSLPIWLCQLPALETLLVDGNPFQGPWKALVDPLLARENTASMYPPSTPIHPPPSATTATNSEAHSDPEDPSYSESPYLGLERHSAEDEDNTIVPNRASLVGRSSELPPPPPAPASPLRSPGLTRTRTAPNRGYFDRDRSPRGGEPSPGVRAVSQHESSSRSAKARTEGQVRRMKSAGELRAGRGVHTAPASPAGSPPAMPSPRASPPTSRPATNYASGSASSSNLLGTPEVLPPRFASLGATNSLTAANARARPALRDGLFAETPASSAAAEFPATAASRSPSRPPSPPPSAPPHGLFSKAGSPEAAEKRVRTGPPQVGAGKKEKGKWGFLRKMSMGKLKTDSPPLPGAAPPRPAPMQIASTASLPRPGLAPLVNSVEQRSASTPAFARQTPAHGPSKLDVRLSSTGALNIDMPSLNGNALPPSIIEPEEGEEAGLAQVIEIDDAPSTALPPSATASTPGFLGAGSSSGMLMPPASPTSRRNKRRSFLPIDFAGGLSIPVPSPSAFVTGFAVDDGAASDEADRARTPSPTPADLLRREEERAREAYTRALRSVMAYLRDMHDLSVPQIISGTPGEGTTRSRRPTVSEVGGRTNSEASTPSVSATGTPVIGSPTSVSTNGGQLRSMESISRLRSVSQSQTTSMMSTDSSGSGSEGRKFKDDGAKRAAILREIVETERTYVKGLQELNDIYIRPAEAPVNVLGASTKDTVVPNAERKVVFSGVEALFSFHSNNFLPALEHAAAAILRLRSAASEDPDGRLSLTAAVAVAGAFVDHAAFMRMYSTYINNFDNAVDRIRLWTVDRVGANGSPNPGALTPSAQVVGLGLGSNSSEGSTPPLNASTRKRIKHYLKRARLSPRHSQLNLEGYLLLPVQRIPRYKLLLEQLGSSTPPTYEYVDPLDKALAEISSLATNMNEGKREAEGRRKLVQWQSRIRGRFPSPLVQPHRRLIMDGPLLLTRVVRKVTIGFEVVDGMGDTTDVQVECLAPEQTPRSLVGILCNDLLVLCRDPSDGRDPGSQVDLWAVLRMQTLPQPASIVHGNVLRLVDNKAILYFEAVSTSDALTWFRAINLHIPSKA
ncbi:hypothetical protein PENSPDRAFT_624362 [Peniophora sp. CONT]|nr:hypothetical protein PENSPDRAFT_624362 [Peniophora sp. CONT]